MTAADGEGSRPRWWVRWHRALLAQGRQLLQEHARPGQLGFAVGLGVMVACSPFYGLHTLIALGLATLFRVNRLAVVLGSHVSTFPLTPVIIFANAQVGAWVLRRRWLELSFAELRHSSPEVIARALFLDLLTGGLFVGAVLGAALGFATARWVARRQARSKQLRS